MATAVQHPTPVPTRLPETYVQVEESKHDRKSKRYPAEPRRSQATIINTIIMEVVANITVNVNSGLG